MLIACWSPKGGSGTTVFSAALALAMAARIGSRANVVLADLAGDVPAALGLPDPEGPGLHDWLTAGADVPDGALAQLETDAGPRLRLLAAGGRARAAPQSGDRARAARQSGDAAPAAAGRGDVLAGLLAADARPVVADCGLAAAGPELALVAGATISILVLRPCYLALRRALAAPIRPSGAVLVVEPGRSLGRADVEDVLGVPVVGQVPYDATVARAVDAGLLARRLPRPLLGPLRRLAADVLGPELAPATGGRTRTLRRPGLVVRSCSR